MKNINIKSLMVGLLLGLSISLTTFAIAEIRQLDADFNDIKITINGEVVDTQGTEPFVVDGRTYVPARFVAEGLGATVSWNGDDKTVEINTENKEDSTETPRDGALKQSQYDGIWMYAKDGEWWYRITIVRKINPKYKLFDPDRTGNYVLQVADTEKNVLENVPVRDAIVSECISEIYFNEVILPIIKPE